MLGACGCRLAAQVPTLLTITTQAMARGNSGEAYMQQLSATGGTLPYAWSISGALLGGLTVDAATGLVSGKPANARCCTVSVLVVDRAGTRVSKIIPFIIDPRVAILGSRYAIAFRNSGLPPYSCLVSVGITPPGLPLRSDCTIDGIPTTAGVYNFMFNIRSSDNVSATLDQTITVRARAQQLLLTQSGLTFTAVAGGGRPPTQQFRVLNGGTGTLDWTATATTLSGGSSWLAVTPSSGSSTADSPQPPTAVVVSADASQLSPGDYYGQVALTSPGVDNSPQSVAVVLSVQPSGGRPAPPVSPTGLIFTGSAGGADPASQGVAVSNLTSTPVTYTAAVSATGGPVWFTATPPSGTVSPNEPAQVTIRPAIAGLAAGVRQGAVRLDFSDGSARTIDLVLVLTGAAPPRSSGPVAQGTPCQPTRLLPLFTQLGANFRVVAGWPTPLVVQVVDDCAGPLTSGSMVVSFSNGDPPVVLAAQADGAWSGTWPARGDSANVSLTAAARNADGTLQGSARLDGGVQANPNPPPQVGGIVSSASYARFVLPAPGGLVSIFGTKLAERGEAAASLPLPTTLGGAQVILGGRLMPLLYAGEGQINALLSYAVAAGTSQQLLIRRGNTYAVPETAVLAGTQPGVFTQTASGSGAAIVVGVRPNGTQFLNTPANPLREGDAMVIYCSGLGPLDRLVTAGDAAPGDPLVRTSNPVAILLDTKPAEVFFAGLAPGFAGLYQVNAFVPRGAPKGAAVPLSITVGGQTSPPVEVNIE